ncbi:MAG: hypothetical protein AABY22_20400 [Nanoarchaeota archaeon]
MINEELTKEMLDGMRDVIFTNLNDANSDKEVTSALAKVLANCITGNWSLANDALVSMKPDTRTLVPLSLQALVARKL